MKIYSSSMHGRGTVFVTPGAEHPETSDWMKSTRGAEGRVFREPVMFTVKFTDGVAEVPDNLGAYMIKKGLAKRSPIVMPRELAVARPRPIAVGRPLHEVAA